MPHNMSLEGMFETIKGAELAAREKRIYCVIQKISLSHSKVFEALGNKMKSAHTEANVRSMRGTENPETDWLQGKKNVEADKCVAYFNTPKKYAYEM